MEYDETRMRWTTIVGMMVRSIRRSKFRSKGNAKGKEGHERYKLYVVLNADYWNLRDENAAGVALKATMDLLVELDEVERVQGAVPKGGQEREMPGLLDDMVADVEKGVLITRFSGGRPSDNGDFSGVAKNSYYIEDGEVKFPLSETMVSGKGVQRRIE